MKFRSAITASTLVLVAAVLVATVGAVVMVAARTARRDLTDGLSRTRRVFDELQSYRQALLRAEARVVAEEPRLKAIVASEETNHETVLGVATEMRNTVGCDLFLMTTATGHLLVDVADPTAAGHDMSAQPLIAAALSKGDASGVWIGKGVAYQMEAHRLAFGTTPVGVLAIGYRVDERVATTVQQQTASTVIIELDGKIVASALEEDAGITEADMGPVLAMIPKSSPTPIEVTIAGKRFLATSGPFARYAGDSSLRSVVLRSLDVALAPTRRLTFILLGILSAGLLAGFAMTAILSRRLSRPLDDLVAFTRRIAQGRLGDRAAVLGPEEVADLARAMNRMVGELETSRKDLAAKERLEQEMDIAMRIQTSILPRDLNVKGLEIAARMLPASEVGGDYYDVLPTKDACWIGIGDVAGHGLTAGLVMLMIQSVVSGLVRSNPNSTPATILTTLNEVVFDNVRDRLSQREHATLTLLRVEHDGRVVFAGAHEIILVARASGDVEEVETPGTWLGATRDMAPYVETRDIVLHPGDVMLLYTDGITEAATASGERFGLDRLSDVLRETAGRSPAEIRDAIAERVTSWSSEQDDDVTLVVVRRSAAA